MTGESESGQEQAYPYSYAAEPYSIVEQVRQKIAPLRFHLAAKEIVKELGLNPNHKVLEIGSGLGLLGREIRKLTSLDLNYFGIDILFDSAKKSKEALIPVRADASRLPFPNKSFNHVISTDVLEHLYDPLKAVQEIYRVLKPGGKAFLVIADPSEPRFFRIVDHRSRSGKKSDVDWWEQLFLACGFEISESSKKYRKKDWRRIFNLPFLAKLKDKPGFACAFNPVHRPGVYVLKKPE